MDEPRVYVLIINWNGRSHLDACFQSLLASTYDNVVFLLVDNGSDDDSVAHVETAYGHDSRVEILPCGKNLGWSGGNNGGIARALAQDAAYIFLLNNDTAVAPDALAHLVKAMEETPDCGVLAPRMVLFDQPEILNSVGLEMSIIGAAWDRGIGRADGPEWHDAVPVAGACGGAMFIRASVLEKTGVLPEEFQIYLDDLDLCLRVWEVGYTVRTCPDAVVRHKFSATMGSGGQARRKYYLNTRNRFWLLLRHIPASLALTILPWVFWGECKALGRSVATGECWRVGAHLRSWASATAYLLRKRHKATGCMPARTTETFWPLVRRTPLFCPALTLPEEGWYDAVDIEGKRWRPMGPVATIAIPEGPLRLSLTNCYPETGPLEVTIALEGALLGRLSSATQPTRQFDVSGGTLTLRATTLLAPDVTGLPMDIGGWIQVETNDNALV